MTTSGDATIDVSILVNTFEKPRHLALVLESIALQRAAGRFEVIVSDDGSAADTTAVVAAFAAHAAFPVRYTSQPHDGFRLARARNAAARLARGDYLLFLDGDCMLPPHHVAAHLARRRLGTALLGFCARLPRSTSGLLVPENLPHTDLESLVPAAEHRAIARRWRKAWWQAALRHPTKPRLVGCDFGVWRDDFTRINGFDERFVGWGQEDDDFGLRLRAAGVRLESILDRTCSLHVWHPTDPTAAPRWRDGPNVAYFGRRGRLTACRRGLVARPAERLRWGLPDDLAATPLGRMAAGLLAGCERPPPQAACEVELVVRPGSGTFHREAECRLLLIADASHAEAAVRRRADHVACVPSADAAALENVLADVG